MSEPDESIKADQAQDDQTEEGRIAGAEAKKTSGDDAAQFPGDLLTQAREAQGLSRVRVSELLGLTQSAIRDIELNRFERFPSGIYVRGYMRNYSKLVGADEKTIMEAYDLYGETNEIPEESPFGSALPNAGESSGKKKGMILVAIVVLTLAIAAAVLVF